MTNHEFATWVRGFLQLCSDVNLDRKKVQMLKNHLNLVVAVEGELGEKNRLLYDRIIIIQPDNPNSEYLSLKSFLFSAYAPVQL